MGMPIKIRWYGPLPEPCIVVANHDSYLDGVVLAATLPPRFDFVIKREVGFPYHWPDTCCSGLAYSLSRAATAPGACATRCG